MITVETNDPVKFSNVAGDDKKVKRQEKFGKIQERARRWDEAGVFGALKNLALTPKTDSTAASNSPADTKDNPDYTPPEDTKKPMNKYLKWGLIVGGVALVGFSVYYFGVKKKANK